MAVLTDLVRRSRARWLERTPVRPESIVEPEPGQESVWDYPRPPRLERERRRVRVELGGVVVADTNEAFRVLETSHPPTYYLPPIAFRPGSLVPASGESLCEWKGLARYFDVVGGESRAPRGAWSYPDPFEEFAELTAHVSVYVGLMDACWVGEHRATPQPGGFYGGWVTSLVAGPFKGAPGSSGW